MKKYVGLLVIGFPIAFFIPSFVSADEVSISPSVTVITGPVNGVTIERDGKKLVVYGDPREISFPVDKVLFTHNRRDVVWAGRPFVRRGAEAIVPAKDLDSFVNAEAFWKKQDAARYNDYAQQTTKVPIDSFEKATGVKGGENIEWQGLQIHVLDTPGYTRGAVSYLFEMDGKRVACVGDLIYGDGKIFDIYSLQDAFDSPKTGGYHGFMGRSAQLIDSLQAVAKTKPDVLIPARGPVIENPQEAIETLIARLRAVYKNYLSICALRWYWKDEYIQGCAERVLGSPEVDWMPMAETMLPKPPEWIVPFGTSRLLVSESGDGFLIDCGSKNVIKEVQKLQKEGRVKDIDGIYITHYHNDHTDAMQEGAKTFGCNLYFCREQAEILVAPERFRMPAMSDVRARSIKMMDEGDAMTWKEFEMTFSYFPGQTLYHGGLMVKKKDGERIFFIGDSFAPSGIDDYCALNRNFLTPASGYLYCLDVLKHTTPDYYLINEHVIEPFRFSGKQLDFMVETLHERVRLLAELLPWDNVNYGLDEQWARIYPYSVETKAGQRVRTFVSIYNQGNDIQTYNVSVRGPNGWKVTQTENSITIPPGEDGAIPVYVTPPADAKDVGVVTADVSFGDWTLYDWAEGLVLIQK